jgi:putative membrane-bound dehydrogenase-like protein
MLAFLALAAPVVAADPKPVAESPHMLAKDKQRLVDFSAELNGSKELYLMVAEIDGNACDWADWIEPEVVLMDGTVVDLTKLKWTSAESLGQTRVGKNYDGKPLKVAGKEYARGIGTHASSFISYVLPGPAKSFRAKVGIDDGGAIRAGKASGADVKFAVFTTRPAKYKPVDYDGGPTAVPSELFTVPEGFEVTVWATSPQIFNPTNIDFDERGRMYVAEGINYRGKKGRRKEGDRIVILEDTLGAGKADKVTVFTQDTNLESPLGVAHIDGKVVVSQPPDLLVYTDVNGDGVIDLSVDKKEVLLTGFNGRQHDHSLHSATFGPDGKWNFNQGNMGADFIDKAGRHFFMGSPYMLQNIAGRRSDDGNVWIGGFSVRMNSDGSELRIVGHNYRNSYEQTINSFGDMYQSDNDDPPACRVSLIMEGGNAGFASLDGKRSWGADKRPGQSTPVAEWRQEDPDTMPAGDVYGGGSPTGVAFYENGAMGEKWNGLLLACEAGKNVVFGYLPKPDGAGMKLERFDFLTSNKEKEWAGSDFLGGKPTGILKT